MTWTASDIDLAKCRLHGVVTDERAIRWLDINEQLRQQSLTSVRVDDHELSDLRVALVCAEFDLDPQDEVIQHLVAQARGLHGKKAVSNDRDMREHWSCDHRGHFSAFNLFFGWIEEDHRTRQADDAAYDSFHEAAFGDD